MAQYKKEWAEKNKDKKKAYYEANKEEINRKQREKRQQAKEQQSQ